MTKEQALINFWSQFDISAYDENTVPDRKTIDYPYITYEVLVGDFGSDISASASLWYRSSSWAAITEKCNEISKAIGSGGILVKYDDGAMWIRKSNTFAQRMGDPDDDSIRRIVLNINIEYISMD